MRGRWISTIVGAGVALAAAQAYAHSSGQPGGGCIGCHATGDTTINVTSSPAVFNPGQTATFTLTISGPGSEAGVFVDADGLGDFNTLGGQGLSEVMAGLTHNTPRPESGGVATFVFEWTAPNQPGAVRFAVSAVSSNNNGSSGGDAAAEDDFDFVYGCQPQTYWRDLDGDGYGRDSAPLIHCAGSAPAGYAANGGDCDDNRDTTYPGATEYCNLRDDDCDGEIDDDALPLTQYPDGDGDGYYSLDEYQSGEMMVGCEMLDDEWAGEPGDCQPFDPTINPGVEEICNLFDDNCDGDVDERVRPQCGEGWCRRESPTCEEAACSPGEPMEESCNLFDDDCDGVIDNDAPCPAGETCVAGMCLVADDLPADGSGSASDGAGDAGSGSGSGATSGPGAASDGGGSGGGCRIGSRAGASSGLLLLVGAFVTRRRRRRRAA